MVNARYWKWKNKYFNVFPAAWDPILVENTSKLHVKNIPVHQHSTKEWKILVFKKLFVELNLVHVLKNVYRLKNFCYDLYLFMIYLYIIVSRKWGQYKNNNLFANVIDKILCCNRKRSWKHWFYDELGYFYTALLRIKHIIYIWNKFIFFKILEHSGVRQSKK